MKRQLFKGVTGFTLILIFSKMVIQTSTGQVWQIASTVLVFQNTTNCVVRKELRGNAGCV